MNLREPPSAAKAAESNSKLISLASVLIGGTFEEGFETLLSHEVNAKTAIKARNDKDRLLAIKLFFVLVGLLRNMFLKIR